MRKFYFIDGNKKWIGPYWLIQVVVFALRGIITPHTYLWHNRLINDSCQHPLQCVYGRKRAVEFGILPFWVFGSNLRIFFFNLLNHYKRKFSKKDGWVDFIQKPIDTPNLLEQANHIYLIPSIVATHDFAVPGDFNVKLRYKELNESIEKYVEYPIRLTKDDEPGVKFEITMLDPPTVGGVLYKESYGLQRRLLLENKNESIEVREYSVFDFTTRYPYKPQLLNGRFMQANLIVPSQYKDSYNRLLLNVDDNEIINPQHLLEYTGSHLYDHDLFNVDNSLMGISFKTGGTFTEITIDNNKYHIYLVSGSLYVIDGIDKEDLEVFKQKTKIIRIALAILCGKFYGGVCNYVTSNDPNFKNIEGVWYEVERNSVLSNRRIIDLSLYRIKKKNDSSMNRPFSAEVFSNLCNKLHSSENILHTAELVISGMNNHDPIQQGALYSVALETLTQELSNEKLDKLQPIPDKDTAKRLKGEMLEVLEKYSSLIAEPGIDILRKKIDNLNSPANQDRLTKVFELYGIVLTEKDIQAIKNRNDYLHGRTPLKRELDFELMQISQRLHTLIVSLLLKVSGYSGHIINLDTHAYLDDEDKMSQIVERQNSFDKYKEEMETAIENRDQEKFNHAKEKLSSSLQEYELSDLIRII